MIKLLIVMVCAIGFVVAHQLGASPYYYLPVLLPSLAYGMTDYE